MQFFCKQTILDYDGRREIAHSGINILNALKKILFALFPFIVPGQFLFAQHSNTTYAIEDTIAANADLFAESYPAEITLIYNIKQYQKNKYKDEYLPAKMIYHFNDAVDIESEVRVKARGNNRRKVCSFPPILLNIKNATIRNQYLRDTKKIKLVTHCSGKSTTYLLKEFLAYKMYNILSAYSFRVRLIRMKYVDTGRKNKQFQTWAFMIEPEEMLAQRLNAVSLKRDRANLQSTDRRETDIMAFFQYMIGNADYSITGRHNIKLLKIRKDIHVKPFPVPYDFDYSGIVNAHYAIPGENLGIQKVTDRYYLGACRTTDEYNSTLEYFKEKKQAMYHWIDAFETLDPRSKKEVMSYLDEFYSSIESKRFVERAILKTCR